MEHDLSLSPEILIDTDGRKYTLTNKTRQQPRRTYIKGRLQGKYWGELDVHISDDYHDTRFFDFQFYETLVSDAEISDMPFDIVADQRLPRERLPALLNIIVQRGGQKYAVNIHEPVIGTVVIPRKLHQVEGKEVFGTMQAIITGYVLDFVEEAYQEKNYLPVTTNAVLPPSPPPLAIAQFYRTNTPTGNTNYNGHYYRIEYYNSDYKTTYWGNWRYRNSKLSGGISRGAVGTVNVIIGLLGLIIIALFAIRVLPVLLPFFILVLLSLLPGQVLRWIAGLFCTGIAVLLLLTLVRETNPGKRYTVPVTTHDYPEEARVRYKPVPVQAKDGHSIAGADTLIMHFRHWRDYQGNDYQGNYWVKGSDFAAAHDYKTHLPASAGDAAGYDHLIWQLKEFDKNHLDGMYQLFDSLQRADQLSQQRFAEMLVSFVQDIPYSLVLSDACNPALYNDEFIRSYLQSDDPQCYPYQRFGINTPVEFLATLKGDCDTRTLLIYTMLAHYNYDVALLSSDLYKHSLIGINLPYDGTALTYKDTRYVVWETTSKEAIPGLMPSDMGDMNYWRISLKSK